MRQGMLTITDLRAHVETGRVDTVLVATIDGEGHLQGKRCAARYFLDEIVDHPANVDERPAINTLRMLPWQLRSAVVLCEAGNRRVAPRQVLRRQIERLTQRGLKALLGAELEFQVFDEDYQTAWQAGYRGLSPGNRHAGDESLLATSQAEPLLGRIRAEMNNAGMYVESAHGGHAPGQHRVDFRADDILTACDNFALFRSGALEIAAQEGKSITFMAKFDEHRGNACRLQIGLRTMTGGAVASGDDGHGLSATMRHFLAGQQACLREFSYLFAPNINSYKRFATMVSTVGWSRDAADSALRVIGSGDALRIENCVPGSDVNPYLAAAGMIAAGLYGIEQRLELDSTANDVIPRTLRDAADLFAASEAARSAFGDEMVTAGVQSAWSQLADNDLAVTDWERYRGFERG